MVCGTLAPGGVRIPPLHIVLVEIVEINMQTIIEKSGAATVLHEGTQSEYNRY
jgi:hypothetical protein